MNQSNLTYYTNFLRTVIQRVVSYFGYQQTTQEPFGSVAVSASNSHLFIHSIQTPNQDELGPTLRHGYADC
jgi:hypothetical protein